MKSLREVPTEELIPFALFTQLGIDPMAYCNYHEQGPNSVWCVRVTTYTNLLEACGAGWLVLKKYDEGYVMSRKCNKPEHNNETLGLVCLGVVAAT